MLGLFIGLAGSNDVFGVAAQPTNLVSAAQVVAFPSIITVYTNGVAVGPEGTIDTEGSTTTGLQEAINAAFSATSAESISNGPPGGAIIQLQAGFYDCDGQILLSNSFPNPITIEGTGVGAAGGSIIRYRGTTNLCETVTMPGEGMYHITLKNVAVTSMAVTTNILFKLQDVYHLRADHCLFAGWEQFTNNTFSGFVGGDASAQGLGLVAFEQGIYGVGFNAGVVEFENCFFWSLASAGSFAMDHQFVADCSFARIGGNNRDAPVTNLWLTGSYHYPESAYALNAAWIDNSGAGDVVFRGRWSSFHTKAVYLQVHQHGGIPGAGPTFIVDTPAQLEAAAWLLFQYDDVSGPLTIISEPSYIVAGACSTVKKPSIITGVIPPGLSFSYHGVKTYGWTNAQLSSLNAAAGILPRPLHSAYVERDTPVQNEYGSPLGMNLVRGTTYADSVDAGVSFDLTYVTLSGGTIAGINGRYDLERLIPVEPFNLGHNTWVRTWTNGTYRVLVNSGSVAATGLGSIFLRADAAYARELYANDIPQKLGTNCLLLPGGTYIAIGTNGTPPTVTVPTFTNNSSIWNLSVLGSSTNRAMWDVWPTNGSIKISDFVPGRNKFMTNVNRRTMLFLNVQCAFDGSVSAATFNMTTYSPLRPDAINNHYCTFVDDAKSPGATCRHQIVVPLEPNEAYKWTDDVSPGLLSIPDAFRIQF